LEKEINLKKLLNLLWKRAWIIITATIACSVLVGIYNLYFSKPIYESSSRIIVNAEPELMTTLMVMMKEPSFLEYVVSEMNLNKTPEKLSQQISAGSVGGSTIVKISVFDPDPEMAAKIANTTAIVFKEKMPVLLGFSGINILSEAKINSDAINENDTRNLLVGILLGLILGVGIIFLIDFLDDTIRSEQNVEKVLGIPVLGSVSKMTKKNTTIKKKLKQKAEVWGESLGDYK
jgi:capsular polysaccharide biosynthesis protein